MSFISNNGIEDIHANHGNESGFTDYPVSMLIDEIGKDDMFYEKNYGKHYINSQLSILKKVFFFFLKLIQYELIEFYCYIVFFL